ncbi:GmrSD restriction endonuclease domain-containing protein [Geodermatophilus marinus]|uniref:GmrSD restriction endonuclease domain-containing protein n=1 Tax=Geodermatophilus sp. LHW52908 TaxID=2303986 RepID=UPI000E3EA7A5|nr:DUF1524 domain-containing protein [Geodermatophilus sp. LHW52908]RFU21786.1 DUF1524 domain-containing protein [Geodermatophilus sp. LHW52908]
MTSTGRVRTGRGPVLRRAVAAALAVVALTACDPLPGGQDTGSPAPAGGGAALAGEARRALEEVPVRGRAPRTGYDRDRFGPAWADVDRNGCDTRNDVLARDLAGVSFQPGTRDCVVAAGTLADPYSGTTVDFRRGQETSDDVQVDHVVALSDAWQKGAQQWDDGTRLVFANDPLNLLAVDGALNQQKGDGDAATWLPPARGYRCAYVARQVAVKLAYGLWMTQAEHDAAAGVLDGCPDEPLPQPSPVTPTGSAPPGTPAETTYADCTEVRAAGAAPIRRGDPGWRDAFDGDGDGVGCE